MIAWIFGSSASSITSWVSNPQILVVSYTAYPVLIGSLDMQFFCFPSVLHLICLDDSLKVQS